MTNQQNYQNCRSCGFLRRVVVDPITPGYSFVLANTGFEYSKDWQTIVWLDGTVARLNGKVYVLEGDTTLNGKWQRIGRRYTSPKQIWSIWQSSNWDIVADKKTLEKLEKDIEEYVAESHLKSWERFSQRNPHIDATNWLNFINFINFTKRRQ